MKKFFINANNCLLIAEKITGSILLFAILAIMLINVYFRYIINNPFTWSDEFNGFAYCWMGFLAGIYAYGKDTHIRITFIEEKVKPQVYQALRIAMEMITIFVFVILYKPTLRIMNALRLAPMMKIPEKYVYIILILSYTLFILHSIFHIYRRILILRGIDDILECDTD